MQFKLDADFVAEFKTQVPQFGFEALGYITYRRTYSRVKDDNTSETWPETVIRVVEGTYEIQRRHQLEINHVPWSEETAQASAQEMAQRMFDMKFLPPGRGLWAMGSKIMDKGLFAALNNCAFVSTSTIDQDACKPFRFLMDSSMLGIGVGFDSRGAGKIMVHQPIENKEEISLLIADTREGWVDSLDKLLKSYFTPTSRVTFDYSQIRKKGLPLKTFGGLSSGPGPLMDMHESIRKVLDKNVGQPITMRSINDIMNLIGRCVVSGNVRRSAEISFGDPSDVDFANLKNYNLNPEREAFGWAANNSIFATLGMDYNQVCQSVAKNGEPGFAWLDNMRAYSRMCEAADNKDNRVAGGNPCLSGDTLITTDRGDIPIQDLVGKSFIALVCGQEFPSTDQGFWSSGIKDVFKIELSDGKSIKATSNHKFIRTDGDIHVKNWTEVKDLKIGNRIFLNFAKEARIIKITPAGQEEVFDCTIPGPHQFIANGIVSHNCLEQSLESYEMCTLVELFPTRCTNFQDYIDTIKYAYLYAKSVTLCPTHWPETNTVMARNRRIGCSFSGIAQFLAKHGIAELKRYFEEGYKRIEHWDRIYSEWLAVRPSIKKTSIKPSGSISLLVGATPGIHYPISRFYKRRMRIGNDDLLLIELKEAGYHIEPEHFQPETTSVVTFPIDSGEGVRSQDQITIWEQVDLAAFVQKYWADNQVSCTATFQKHEEKDLPRILDLKQWDLKGISFLPYVDPRDSPYPQLPYEPIKEEQYLELKAQLKPIRGLTSEQKPVDSTCELFCDGDVCLRTIPQPI